MYLVILVPQFLTYKVEHIVTATILSINSLFLSDSIKAQIVPDETLNTQVNLIDGQQKITGGTESGTNLFHSFKEFSPTADFGTHFDNNNYIQNIFIRVTGDSASLIDGLLKTNDSASLFILNPAGIIFGNNAQLGIGGSFITTTAESIMFADGTKFDTKINQSSPLLTVSIPIGLQYGNNPGAISSSNTEPINLNLSPGNTIAFLGGNIDLRSISIKAFSGNVDISGIAEGEIISLYPSNNKWEFQYNNVSKFNDIKISQKSRINASGSSGNVNLQGQDIILNHGINIENTTNTDFDGGNISLSAANDIDLNNIFLSTEVGGLDENGLPLEHPVQGKGGNIIIEAQDIKIRNGSVISASTLDQGAGGDITIYARESLELSGFNELRPSLILSGVADSGAGGNVQINTVKFVITDSSRIDSSTFGAGKAGNIIVNAHESIVISGNKSFFSNNLNKELKFNSGLIASSGFEGLSFSDLGESGSLIVNTPRLSIEDGGEISVSNFGSEDAGDININVEELLLNNDSQITGKTASGNGGSINVNSNQIVLRDEATIAATADFNRGGGDGNGGNIAITADNMVMFDDSSINANAFEGRGGNISITTQSLLTHKNPEDAITASSERGIDGIVEINTPDTNSKLETIQARIAPLAGEESIDTSCASGTDFSANKFVYIGRGGIPSSPFESTGNREFLGDLGLEESLFEGVELDANYNFHHQKTAKTPKLIIEATAWIVNAQGNVELIAQAANDSLPSGCLFNSYFQ